MVDQTFPGVKVLSQSKVCSIDPFGYRTPSEYVHYGYVLALMPILFFVTAFWGVLPWFASLIPLVFLIVLDIIDAILIYPDGKKFSYSVPDIATAAKRGRAKLTQQCPPKTGKRYLIIGTGGLGHRMVTMLQERGEKEVYGMDIDENNLKIIQDPQRRFQADVTRMEDCCRVIEQVQPNIVYHTAAIIQALCWRNSLTWEKTKRINVDGVCNMIRACQQKGREVETFILTSSIGAHISKQMAYKTVAINEDSPLQDSEENAENWYGRSKAMAEILGKQAAKEAKIKNYAVIRVAGGIYHHRDTLGLVAFRNETTKMAPFVGFEHRLFDNIYVDNAVLGHLLLEEKLQKQCPGVNYEAFMIGGDEDCRMASQSFHYRCRAFLLAYLKGAMRKDETSCVRIPNLMLYIMAIISEIYFLMGKIAPGDVGKMSFNFLYRTRTVGFVLDYSDKAQKLLGYKPAFTFDEGIADMIERSSAEMVKNNRDKKEL